jgi:hypothetical protein
MLGWSQSDGMPRANEWKLSSSVVVKNRTGGYFYGENEFRSKNPTHDCRGGEIKCR